MSKLFTLIKWEFFIQNKINNIIKYLFIFFLFYILSIALINDNTEISKFSVIFSVIYIPISLIGFSTLIFKQDVEDGSLELLLSQFSTIAIITSKFLSILISAMISSMANAALVYIMFDINLPTFYNLVITAVLLLMNANALLILIASVQIYFRSNTNIISILIMPLIIPNIVISGLIIKHYANTHLILIMIGINFITVPLSLILSCYLIKNIYNFGL